MRERSMTWMAGVGIVPAAAVRAARVGAAKDKVLAALSGLDSYLTTISGGGAWAPYVRSAVLRSQLADPSGGDEARATAQAVAAKLRARAELADATQREF